MTNLTLSPTRTALRRLAFATLSLAVLASLSHADHATYSTQDPSLNLIVAAPYPSGAKMRVSKRAPGTSGTSGAAWTYDFTLPTGWVPYNSGYRTIAKTDAMGNVFVAQMITNSNQTRTRVQLYRLTSAGAQPISAIFDPLNGSNGVTTVSSITTDSNNNLYIAGYYRLGSGSSTAYVAKFSSSLGLVGTQTPSLPGYYLYVGDLGADLSGNVYVGMTALSQTTNAGAVVMQKLNSSFAQQWSYSDTGLGIPGPLSGTIHVDSNNARVTYVTQAQSATSVMQVVAIQRPLSGSTSPTWTTATTVAEGAQDEAATLDPNGDIVVAASTVDATTYRLIKFSGSTGNWIADAPVAVPGAIFPSRVCVDASGDYLVNHFVVSGSNLDSVVERFAQSSVALTNTYTFANSDNHKDYVYGVYPTNTVGQFMVAGVGLATFGTTTKYSPLVYCANGSSTVWSQYLSSVTP